METALNCSGCQHQNPNNSRYCNQCGHSLEQKADQAPEKESVVDRLSVKSYAEAFVKFTKISPWLSWLFLWQALLLIDHSASRWIFEKNDHWLLMPALLGFFCLNTLGIIFCSREFEKLSGPLLCFVDMAPSKVLDWYAKHTKLIYGGGYPIISGLCCAVALPLLGSPLLWDLCRGNTLLFGLRLTILVFGFFWLGVALWALLAAIYVAREIPTALKLKVGLYHQDPNTSVLAVGRLFFRQSLFIVMVYSMAAIAVLVSPYSHVLLIQVILLCAAPAVIMFFIVPQWGVHAIMAVEKSKKMEFFSRLFDEALTKALAGEDPDGVQRVKELLELQDYLRRVNDWPFDVSALWQLLTALIIPIGIVVVEIFWK